MIQPSTDIPLAVERSVPTDLPRSENEAQNPIDTTLPANDDALSPGETKTRRRPIDPRVARLFVALEAGEIPRELRETFKLVDPASPLGSQFQEAMLAMLESVAPGNSFRESGYRFILSHDDDMAMGAFAKAKPPIVVVGSTFLADGFFKMEPTAELLYGCVIHERVTPSLEESTGNQGRGDGC